MWSIPCSLAGEGVAGCASCPEECHIQGPISPVPKQLRDCFLKGSDLRQDMTDGKLGPMQVLQLLSYGDVLSTTTAPTRCSCSRMGLVTY